MYKELFRMILFICIFVNRKCNCIMKCGVAGRMEIMGTKVNLNKELNGYILKKLFVLVLRG